MSADELGAYGHENVRVDVVVDGPEASVAELIVYDHEENPYDLVATGHWGLEEGFFLKAAYDEETDITATFDTPGQYTITLTLIDLDNDHTVITSEIIIIDVDIHP